MAAGIVSVAMVLAAADSFQTAGGGSSSQNAGTAAVYENPVLPGDFPDPSLIRVGNDYWATATTSQWAPIFPLLHSTDLVGWRRVGSVFQTPPAWSAGSYWAPEISEDRGRFFVYYTARKRNGPLCVAVAVAAKPQGPYTDRGPLVCQEAGSIDAAAIRDEKGQLYLVWKEDGNSRKLPTPIWAQPLSDDGTALIGEKHEILRNEAPWEAHLVEGPFVLHRGEWFYLFYSADACCGRGCNYKLGVARSRQLLGPWERHPANPLLAANEYWKCPGHGSLATVPGGRTYLLYHAYHPTDFEYVGRQGLLDEVTWDPQGWPVINGGHGPSHSAPSPSGKALRKETPILADDFRTNALDPEWQWPWDQTEQPGIDTSRGGWLRLRTASAASAQAMSVAARPTLAGTYTATTSVDVSSLSSGARAGLAAFGNRDNVLAVSVERSPASAGTSGAGALTVTVWRTQKGASTTLTTDAVDAGDVVHLQLKATDRTRFDFAVGPDGKRWKTVAAQTSGGYLPPWDLSVRIALIVTGPPGASGRFGAFRLERREE
jgi:beta-xylosidase